MKIWSRNEFDGSWKTQRIKNLKTAWKHPIALVKKVTLYKYNEFTWVALVDVCQLVAQNAEVVTTR